MINRWFIEEEIIEGAESDQGYSHARETRLVNPRGEVLARRLAYHGAIWEDCLVLHKDQCVAYREGGPTPPTTGLAVRLTSATKEYLASNLTMFLYKWDFDIMHLWHAEWQQQERLRLPTYKSYGLYAANYVVVSTYQVKAVADIHKVEWRVYLTAEPLGGFPVYRELLLDNRLYRRHWLLYRRLLSQTGRELFAIPRGIKLRFTTSIEEVLDFAEYQLIRISE